MFAIELGPNPCRLTKTILALPPKAENEAVAPLAKSCYRQQVESMREQNLQSLDRTTSEVMNAHQ